MSKSGSNNSANTQNMKDIQGGEKKVMKKSLSIILSSAMALSMFSSVALGADAAATTKAKTSADFTDLKDLTADQKVIFDAMISAGIFDGVADGKFGLNDNMNRAQFAKVAALIFKLNVDATLKTSSFNDVKTDDPSNGYALPYIEAVKAAKITDGFGEGIFNPAGQVTKEQLAAFVIRGLGKDAEAKATPGVSDKTVSDWAKGYVAYALSSKLVSNGADGTYGGTSAASRALLVNASYTGQKAFADANKPATVSVASVKATGVKTVQVTLDRDVDTSKATLSLTTAGTAAVATTTKWSDDKKSATLTLTDTVIRAGEYKVTLGGLDASTVKLTTGTFTGQDETVQKIDFVTASDTLAQAKNVVVKIKATNQYGEMAAASAGNYNFYGATKLTKNIDGYLLATVDTSAAVSGVGIVTVTIINNDSHITSTKNFTVGTPPILTKLELGAPKYTNGTALSGSGDNAKVSLNLYDQYGSMMGYDALNIGTSGATTPTLIWNDFLEGTTYVTEDDGNNNPILKISVGSSVDKSGDYRFTVIDQAASASGKITIQSSKVATKIQIGSYDDVIAAGDRNVYIPVVAFDAAGNQLTTDEIVNDDNWKRITVSGGNIANNSTRLEKAGNHKGTIHLTNITGSKNGSLSLSAFIATANVSSTDTKTYTIQGARIPDKFKELTAPANQVTAGGFTAFQYAVLDQYGKQLDDVIAVDNQGNAVVGGTPNYQVTVQANTYNAGVAQTTLQRAAGVFPAFSSVTAGVYGAVVDDNDNSSATVVADSTPFNIGTDIFKGLNDNTWRFTSAPNSDGTKIDFALRIMKQGTDSAGNTVWNELTKFTKSVTVANALDDLTYSIGTVVPLWNALDSDALPVGTTANAGSSVTTNAYGGGWYFDNNNATYTSLAQLSDPTYSRFAREVTVSGKNKAGESVGVAKQIKAITSSDTTVAKVAVKSSTNKAYVLGYKAGTTVIGVTFVTAKGETKTINTTITVKNDPLNVSKITWDQNAYYDNLTFNAFLNLNVTDSYGRVYEDNASLNGVANGSNGRAQRYNYVLGVTFSVTNVVNGTVTVDQYGNVTVTQPVGSTADVTFDLTATAPTGKSSTVSISSGPSHTTRTIWK